MLYNNNTTTTKKVRNMGINQNPNRDETCIKDLYPNRLLVFLAEITPATTN